MKTILKFVITIAIIVGVVFGVIYFIGNKKSVDSVYTGIMSSEVLPKTLPSEYEKDFSVFWNYINTNQSELPVEVKNSIGANGMLTNTKLFYNAVRGYMLDLVSKTASVYKLSKEDIKELNNLQTKLLNSIKQSTEKFGKASKLINDCNNVQPTPIKPSEQNLKYHFNICVEGYQDTLKILTDYTLKLSDIVKNNLFGGKATDINFVLNRTQTKMISLLFTKNSENQLRYNELINSATTLNTQIQTLKAKNITDADYQTFMLNYSACNEQDIFNLLLATNKQTFVDESTNANLEKVALYLFNITKTPATPEPPLEPVQNVGEGN